MFPTFEELYPIFDHMFKNGQVTLFMTDLSVNSECRIPTLPPAICEAAAIRISSIQALIDCYSLQSNGDARIKELRLKTPIYRFSLHYSRGYAILKTRSTGIVTVYRNLVQEVPGLTLRLVMPAQN